ncbi:MAG: alpha/beta hydrolase [Methylobacterium mesophilicum]|nr:alpha/beta hydrolase [Methylobacterium mesophilicum]
MAIETLIHHAPSGAALNVHLCEPTAPPRAVVQISHGLAEHAGRYRRFMEALAAHGFFSVAHDHRGHGATRAPDAPPGRFAAKGGADAVLADVLAIHDLVAARHPGVPVIVFGHSMGGLIALNFVLRHAGRVHAAAIWNANFTAGLLGHLARTILAWERFRLGSDVPSRLLPRLTFQAWGAQVPNAQTPFGWLSRDETEVAKYVADPLCGWDASVSLWQDLFALIFSGAENRNFDRVTRDMPFQLIGGGDDPATSKGQSVTALERRLRQMGFQSVETLIYDGTRHETLNELNRDEATGDFIAWAHRVSAPRAGPDL